MDKITIYLHGSYSHSEIEEVYKLHGKANDELYDAMYEVELVYNFKTKKIELPEVK